MHEFPKDDDNWRMITHPDRKFRWTWKNFEDTGFVYLKPDFSTLHHHNHSSLIQLLSMFPKLQNLSDNYHGTKQVIVSADQSLPKEFKVLLELQKEYQFKDKKFHLLNFPSNLSLPSISFKNEKKGHVAFVYLTDDTDSRWRSMGTPMAPLILANSVENSGYTTEIVSINSNTLNYAFENTPDVVAVSVFESNFEAVNAFLKNLKLRLEVKVIAGGPFVTLTPIPAMTYMPEVDAFVTGEADQAIGQVVDHLNACEDKTDTDWILSAISLKGVAFNLNDISLVCDMFSPKIVKEKDMVSPDYRHLKKRDFLNGLEYSTSRGCNRHCIFCSHVHGKVPRQYSLTRLQSDLKSAARNFSLQPWYNRKPESLRKLSVNFNDDDILINPERTKKLLKVTKAESFQVWGLQTAVESLLDKSKRRDLLHFLKQDEYFVNEPVLWIGTDAFSDERLHRLGKTGTISELEEICVDLESYGFKGYHYWIVSDLESNWEELFEELLLIRRFRNQFPESFHVLPNAGTLIPFLSTPAYARVQKKNSLGRIILKEIKSVSGFPELDYPIIKHEKPQDDYLYSLVEPESMSSKSHLTDSRSFLKLIREGRIEESIMLAINTMNLAIHDEADQIYRSDLEKIKSNVMNLWFDNEDM